MALWSACFGDPPGALAAYFNLRHRDEYMPVWAQDGAIVGMLSMLPVALRVGGASYPGRYVFAVATDPAWRGRGISTQLLAFAHDWMRQNGVRLSALVPADQGLFDFYGRRGYKTYFYQRRLSLSPAELPLPPVGARVARCDAAAWLEARDRAFEACPFVRWGEDALAFMMNDEWLDGGGVARVDTPTGRAIAAWDWDGDQAVVRELALQGLAAPQALAALHELTREVNRWLDGGRPLNHGALTAIDGLFRSLGGDVLGIIPDELASSAAEGEIVDGLIALLLDARQTYRAERNWARADAVRDQLAALGIVVEDRPEGPTWRLER